MNFIKNSRIIIAAFLSIFVLTNNYAQDTEIEALGLPGDNLDLYATLALFQNSKTIEDFEKELNKEDTGINNLDLDLDEKVDFIKVTTEQYENDFIFKLQVDTGKEEVQDVAAIFVSKDKNGDVSLQMVGNEDLYGKDYIIEPKTKTESVTANPAYSGADKTEVENQPAEVIVVESEPIVKYIYSPVYVPYYTPYYWGYYPPYYRPWPVISFNIYWGRHSYYHNRYYGGRYGGGNTVIINNNRTYNNYRSNTRSSQTVRRNSREGNYTRNRSNRTATANNRASTANNRANANNRASDRSSNARNRSTGSSTRNYGSRSSFYNNRTNTNPGNRNRSYNRPTPTTRQAVNRSQTRPISKPSRMGGGRRR